MSTKDYDVIVVKVPLKNKIKDYPINFPPLSGLHLELLENKKKLKPGLPLIPFKPKPLVLGGEKRISQLPTDSSNPKTLNGEVIRSPSRGQPRSQPTSTNTSRAGTPKPDDSNLINALGSEKQDTQGNNTPHPTENSDNPRESNAEETPQEPEKTPEELEEEERQELRWKFKILKKAHPELNIPEYHDHSDVKTMRRDYDEIKKGLHLDSSVGTYKKFLIGGFMALEFCATKFVGIDLTGLTRQQMMEMSKYEELLIELGEKSYSTFGANLPVEVRLLGLIVLNTAIFYVGRIVASKSGEDVLSFFNMMMSKKKGKDEDDEEEENSKKMKGPSIRPEDIRKMAKD